MLMIALMVSNFSIIGSHRPPLCERRNSIEVGAPGWPLSKMGDWFDCRSNSNEVAHQGSPLERFSARWQR